MEEQPRRVRASAHYEDQEPFAPLHRHGPFATGFLTGLGVAAAMAILGVIALVATLVIVAVNTKSTSTTVQPTPIISSTPTAH
jgi:hypothetical protein